MSSCCLAADVSYEPTVCVICVDDQGNVTTSFCATLHAIAKLPTQLHSKLQERCPCHGSGVAGLLSRRPGFDCRAVYLTAVVDMVELGQVILQILRVSPAMPLPYTHIPLI